MLVTAILVGLAAQFLPGTVANCDCPIYQPEAKGKDIVTQVEEVINGLKIFPTDHNFLCRVACVESDFGEHPETFKKNKIWQGGIWQVTKKAWEETVNHQGPITKKYRKLIQDKLGIDWTKTKYEDIVKIPLLNGLAARLYIARITVHPIPTEICCQAHYWKDHFNTHHDDAMGTVSAFLKCLEEHKDVCDK